jgi:hypothetical protein
MNRAKRARHSRVVDELVERYVDWREASAAVHQAYRWWSNASPREAAVRYAVYCAALDLEECAANLYARACTQFEGFAGELELAA